MSETMENVALNSGEIADRTPAKERQRKPKRINLSVLGSTA